MGRTSTGSPTQQPTMYCGGCCRSGLRTYIRWKYQHLRSRWNETRGNSKRIPREKGRVKDFPRALWHKNVHRGKENSPRKRRETAIAATYFDKCSTQRQRSTHVQPVKISPGYSTIVDTPNNPPSTSAPQAQSPYSVFQVSSVSAGEEGGIKFYVLYGALNSVSARPVDSHRRAPCCN